MLTQATIQQIGDRIADYFQLEKIILFGSYARGEAHPHSDLDLLVVVETLPPRGQRSAPILKMLAETYTEPIDIVVRSAQTLKQWEHVPGSFSHQVLTEGVVLYDRQKQPALNLSCSVSPIFLEIR
ncbi:MAG: nucleotidyltransferase domain-containing protein [Tildeniella torsiva UHER 1998/13D]|jgi:predicted nucleotidyltransferase|nr:nucleotidyltransferase domain-containing protein [Tildeniella torsiva UHER 1998/13D]